MLISLLFHPELSDYPGFWILALLFLLAIVAALFIVLWLIRKLFSGKSDR